MFDWVLQVPILSIICYLPLAGAVIIITAPVLLKSGLLVLGLSLLAGVYPAVRSALVAPVASMREMT